MGIQDWEPRALPSEARCRKWAEQGMWFNDGKVCIYGNPMLARANGIENDWRPWKDNNPATWSDFYAATHPPIPEGWEKVGEWQIMNDRVMLTRIDTNRSPEPFGLFHSGDGFGVEVRRILPAIPAGWEAVGEWHDTLSPCSEVYDWTLLQDGRIVQRGETFRRQDERIMGIHIRRVFGAVDWGDVPVGVEIGPNGEVSALGAWLFGTVKKVGRDTFEAVVKETGKTTTHPSQPAAIVALTGRRE